MGTLDESSRRGASVISTVSLTRKEHQVPVRDQFGDNGDSDDPFNSQSRAILMFWRISSHGQLTFQFGIACSHCMCALGKNPDDNQSA
jgi:hypothetical protein